MNMENEVQYLFVRDTSPTSNDIYLEFQYTYNLSVQYFYSFLRPLTESLESLFKKITLKITKLKYRKCPKKLKNQQIIDSCHIKALCRNSLEEIQIDKLTIRDILSEDIVLQINEFIYHIYVNPPWIYNCKLPKISMVNCPVYPILEIQNIEADNLNVVWFVGKSKTSTEWVKIQNGILFTPSQQYLNFYIKVEVTSSISVKAQSFSAISSLPIQEFPQTEYQLAMMFDKSNICVDDNVFRLCTYNILSNIYASTKQAKTVLYRHCDPQFLARDYRQCLILKELIQNQLDIIFLQEVDQEFYNQSLYPILKIHNFDGIYQNKSKNNLEGQAIFWNIDKFNFLKNISVPCISSATANNNVVSNTINDFLTGNTYICEKWQSLGQCMTGCVLETKTLALKKTLILSNNHLFFHPKFEILRLFQLAVVLSHIEQIKTDHSESACIIGGDFNASYEDESIKFVFENAIEFGYMDKSISLHHNLTNLSSAFKGVLEFSNFTPDYVGLLDHIIFEDSQLKVKTAYGVPSRVNILENSALPNRFHPSDHLPLFCDIAFL